ncbi:MAG: restriction endonuclease subunit S [Oscillospiraceae bacterium]|nr:restriction endonuclease subunit S [Oscillospiraceae bacterium]
MKYNNSIIGDIASVQTGPFGSQLHKEDYVVIGTPIVTVEHLGQRKMSRQNLPCVSDEDKNRLSKYILKYGDLVFSRVGSVDRCSWVSEEENGWMFSGRCLRVRPNNPSKIYHKYLYYFFNLETTKEFVRNIAVGATMPSINTKLLSEVPIAFPNITEQQQVGDILSVLDDRIEANSAINHHLEQMALAVFKSWFVDFEPFGGVMPDDWREGILSEIANVTMGQSPDGTSYNEDGIGTVFYQGRAEFGLRFPTRRLFTTQPKRMAAKGDVLMSVRAPVGDLNVAFESCCLGRGLAGIESKDGCQSFILYTMFALKQKLDLFNGEGTVFGSINKNDMANLHVLIPTNEILRQFEDLVNPMDAAIEANFTESNNLQAIRDTLLPRLMSGELFIADLSSSK